jgi:hypothetical protein
MKVRRALLVALATAVALTSVATAGPAKQGVQIDLKFPGNTFVLRPLEPGAIKRDSGTQSCAREPVKRAVFRNGEEALALNCLVRLVGNRGNLVLHSRFTWIETGGAYDVATGTWQVVRGTGAYARITGSGRSAHVGTLGVGRSRYQGFLTSR